MTASERCPAKLTRPYDFKLTDIADQLKIQPVGGCKNTV